MSRLLFVSLVLYLSFPDNLSSQEERKGTLILSGYMDGYYQYNFNSPLSNHNSGRVFDLLHDNISLGLVQTKLDYSKGKSKVLLDLTFGPNAELGNFGNKGTALSIKQAYFSYGINDNISFTIGQYGTHIGYELIDAPRNFNYSLSYLFVTGPFYHTGLKFDFKLSDKIGMMAGIINGWDALQDYNDKKSFAFQFSAVPVEKMNIYLNWIGGDEYGGASAFGDHKGSSTNLFDLTASYEKSIDTLGQRFLVGLNAAYGSFKASRNAPISSSPYDQDATWDGAAVYFNYFFNNKTGLGLRAEYFKDEKGVRYFGPLSVFGFTLTGDFRIAEGSLIIKPELRIDNSKDLFFEDENGGGKLTQTTIGVGVIYTYEKGF